MIEEREAVSERAWLDERRGPSQALSLIVAWLTSRHAIRWGGLLSSFVIFGLAIWRPDWRTIAAASAYAVLVTWPAWLRKGGE